MSMSMNKSKTDLNNYHEKACKPVLSVGLFYIITNYTTRGSRARSVV